MIRILALMTFLVAFIGFSAGALAGNEAQNRASDLDPERVECVDRDDQIRAPGSEKMQDEDLEEEEQCLDRDDQIRAPGELK